MSRYAAQTYVPISQSRGEIDQLLRAWRADGVQWTDDWSSSRVTLRFLWPDPTDKTLKYSARFDLRLPTDEQIRKSPDVKHKQTGEVLEARIRQAQARRGMTEHRILLLWLKAAFNAVKAGLVSAEQIFLPFLEGYDGKTVSEIAIGNLKLLKSGPASGLLALPAGAHK